MANPFLKLASGGKEPKNPAREKLAIAVAEHEGVVAGINESHRRESDLMDRRIAARRALEAAGEAVETARQAVISNPGSKPALTVREAREAVVEAEDHLADLQAASAHEIAHRAGLENRQSWTQSAVNQALREVVAADPAVKELCDRFMANFREHVDMRRALEYLHKQQCLPKYEGGLCEQTWPDLAGAGPWRAAIEGLRTDAETPLPEIR